MHISVFLQEEPLKVSKYFLRIFRWEITTAAIWRSGGRVLKFAYICSRFPERAETRKKGMPMFFWTPECQVFVSRGILNFCSI